jgi:hypothetical protein
MHGIVRPDVAQCSGIVVDAAQGFMAVVGCGSAAVIMWSPAWISMVRCGPGTRAVTAANAAGLEQRAVAG